MQNEENFKKKNYKDIILLFYNVMALPVPMCSSENWKNNRVDRRTIEKAEISEISLCVYAFPHKPLLATYDMRMQG